MPHLTSLAPEMLGLIVNYLEYASDLNAFSQACRLLLRVTNARLYGVCTKNYLFPGLLRIARNGNADAARKLLAVGAISKEQIKHRERALIPDLGCRWRTLSQFATEKGHVNILQYLLDMGVSLKRPSDHPTMPGLMLDTMLGSVASLRFLVEKGPFNTGWGFVLAFDWDAALEASDKATCNEFTFCATASGNENLTRRLLNMGCDATQDIESPLVQGVFCSPLVIAAFHGNVKVTEILLRDASRNLQIICVLIGRRANVNYAGFVDTPMIETNVLNYLTQEELMEDDLVIFEGLLNRGANPLVHFDKEDANALKHAVKFENAMLVKLYLDAILKNGYHHPQLLRWVLQTLQRDYCDSWDDHGAELEGYTRPR
ncbi:ankyrin repeat-containing domain protein [Penicillium capsulatum]|nr:ankyrin repeat-containing domain protein [Penicillium capsulatum]